jgi:hypothetical protein
MFVFGIDIPLPEILFIVILLVVVALVFIILQMRHVNRHMRVLEDTTSQIRKFEDEALATKVVNNVAFYLEFFHKMPDRAASQQLKAADQMRVPTQK